MDGRRLEVRCPPTWSRRLDAPTASVRPARRGRATQRRGDGAAELTAPMVLRTIVRVARVAEGDPVAEGDLVVVPRR